MSADPLRPRPSEPTVEGRLAELDALRAALARVEALRVQWETSDVRLSRRFAANELRRALEGEATRPSGRKTYFETVRSLSSDPEVRGAIDETEARGR